MNEPQEKKDEVKKHYAVFNISQLREILETAKKQSVARYKRVRAISCIVLYFTEAGEKYPEQLQLVETV